MPEKADFKGVLDTIQRNQETVNKVRQLRPELEATEEHAKFSRAISENRSPKFNERMLIPPRFAGKTLANFDDTHAAIKDAAVVAILSDQSLFLSGPPGIGKTHLAVGLMREWAATRPAEGFAWPKFLPVVELMQELKREMDRGMDGETVLDRWSRVALLVLDDLGAEKVSEWATSTIYTLIDRRYREMKPMIITSNYDLDAISKRLDDRISSRLAEMGLMFAWKDHDRRTAR